MAVYRTFYPNFWSDPKVVDTFTPEDKYFMLWAVTNDHVNMIGCYEVSIKQIARDMGYNNESIEHIIKRFNDIHKNILYDFDTKELIVLNFPKYNWNESPKINNTLKKEIESVKSPYFKGFLIETYNKRKSVSDTLCIPYPYGINSTVTVSVTDTVTDKDINTNTKDNTLNTYKEIIEYLNTRADTNFRYTSKGTQKLINGRMKDGYGVEAFKSVIDKKTSEWVGTKWESYLGPSTLFAPTNFENYLNQKGITKNGAVEKSSADYGIKVV